MDLHGHLPAKGLVHQRVFGHRRQPLFATHDVRNCHEVVIDYVGEVIGWEPIRLEQYQIA